MPLGYNRVLGDPKVPAAHRPHRVALSFWPSAGKDPRTDSLDALLNHVSASGYEGVEFAADGFMRFFPDESKATVARKARTQVEKAGLRIFGSTLHLKDANLRKLHWLDPIAQEMQYIQDMGGEFASVQFELPTEYACTGGVQREDEDYLKWAADTLTTLRDKAWSMGLNFYLETHILQISEDPGTLCRILEMCDCELNGDLSHYMGRGFTQGKYVDKIINRVNFMHVRMARKFGDISAVVEDPKADWAAKGLTWQLFQFQKPALAHGLSSRTISGETGRMHLVQKALDQDATLVPYYRAMARFADAAAQGIVMKVDEPGDFKPWG